MKTICMAIIIWAIMAIKWKRAIIAVMARLEMAANMVFRCVFSKNSKNADQQPKRFLKI